MNTEKLYSICEVIHRDFTENKPIEYLNQIVKALQNVVNNPSDSNQQNNIATQRRNLQNALNKSYANDLSPAWRQMLKEIGGSEFVGKELLTRIDNIFGRNQITPAAALQEMKELQQQVSKFQAGVNSIIQGFDDLGLKKDELEENHSEIGFLIPRDFIDNDLKTLGNEIHEISFILNHIREFVTGEKESFKIKSLSSSDPFITITTETVLWVYVFARAVDWLLSEYKKLLDIRKLHNELKEKGLSKGSLKGIEEHADELMEKAVDKIVIEIDKEHYGGNDPQRRNELKNGLRIGFNKLVNRFDKGYNVEIRISEPDVPEKEEEQKKADKDKLKLYEEIHDLTKKIEFMKVEGESILSLPEGDKDKSKKTASEKKPDLKL